MSVRLRRGPAPWAWSRTAALTWSGSEAEDGLLQDLGLLVGAVGTSVVGALLVWSATHETAGTAYLVRHLLNTAIGIALYGGLVWAFDIAGLRRMVEGALRRPPAVPAE